MISDIENKKKISLQCFLELLIGLIYIEAVFRLLHGQTVLDLTFFRIILFCLAASLIGSSAALVCKRQTAFRIVSVILYTISIYSLIQCGFHDYLGNYTSIHAAGDGAGRILDSVIDFLSYLKPQYFLLLIAPIAGSVYHRYCLRHTPMTADAGHWKLFSAVIICAVCLNVAVVNSMSASLISLYAYPKFIEKSIREFGTGRYLLRDIFADSSSESTLSAESTASASTAAPSASEEAIDEDGLTPRIIDDTEWKKLAEAETNETIQTIDSYLMNRSISQKNEMTGVFAGKNLIYILVEAFDYIAIDPELTPTLYMMQQEGWNFTDHYTPKYSCTTGESEFIGLMSLVPESDVCTPNQYENNTYSESIYQLFKNSGYSTSAYHNWEDQYYDRRVLYSNSGCDNYYNIDDMSFDIIQGWQSDVDLMKEAIPHFSSEEPFFAFIITSSTHFPYDESSTLGDKYLDEVNAVHPDYPLNIKRYLSKAMELDKAMEYLLDELEKSGELEDTVICMFADHHPLKTSISQLVEYTTQFDRSLGLNEDVTPFFIYNSEIDAETFTEVNSTFDMLPTLANMFDLDYDPRYYVGTDYFGGEEKIAIFTNGDWVSEHGIYYADTETFEPAEGYETDETYIADTNAKVQNMFKISSMIYGTDYFAYRN